MWCNNTLSHYTLPHFFTLCPVLKNTAGVNILARQILGADFPSYAMPALRHPEGMGQECPYSRIGSPVSVV